MLICCGTDKLQGMSGEWASEITKGTVEHFRGLGIDGTMVDNLDPNSTPTMCDTGDVCVGLGFLSVNPAC